MLVRRLMNRPGIAGIVFLAAGMTTAAGWVDWSALVRWLRPHGPWVVLCGVGAALMAAAVTHGRRQEPPRRTVSALSWWTIAAGGAVIASVAWGATAWLLGEADQAKDPA